TFVSFDDGLNVAMQKLRGALGDNAEAPRYIETVPRQGYRFVAHVTGAEAAGFRGPARTISIVRERGGGSLTEQERGPAGGESARQNGVLGRWGKLLAGSALLIAVSGAAVLLRPSRQPVPKPLEPVTMPLISLPGEQSMPAFSPDGSRVAL